MTVFYQHIGERLWERDAPRSIGTDKVGLKRFFLNDVDPYLRHLNPSEYIDVRRTIQSVAPTGFQIWGLPQGASGVLSRMHGGDFLMLLESTEFAYVGQVIFRVSEPCWDLSRFIWTEQRFPMIVMLQGELIRYPWDAFLQDFKFAPNYHMRGTTAALGPQRIPASKYETEETFIAGLLTTKGVRPWDQERDFRVFANNLEAHLRDVKERANQQAFRSAVMHSQGVFCAACGLDVPVALEAAHIVPKEHNGTDDPRNGLLLCANHHRMFDAHLFTIDPASLAIKGTDKHELPGLGITRGDLRGLRTTPHIDALRWRRDFLAEQANRKELSAT